MARPSAMASTIRASSRCVPDVFTLLELATPFDDCDVPPNAEGHAAIAAALAEVVWALAPSPVESGEVRAGDNDASRSPLQYQSPG